MSWKCLNSSYLLTRVMLVADRVAYFELRGIKAYRRISRAPPASFDSLTQAFPSHLRRLLLFVCLFTDL